MKQSRLASWLETIGSTATGFLLSLGIQYGICWLYGLPLRLHDNLLIIGIFTVASLLRSYAWRRLMEAMHVRRPLSPFMQAVVAERFRQVEAEGWSHEHDDGHATGELARAGATYAAHSGQSDAPSLWPWAPDWWKPAGFRRDLVKAAALIVAEGEKFDRARWRRPDDAARAS
jgi:hypothetical protein